MVTSKKTTILIFMFFIGNFYHINNAMDSATTKEQKEREEDSEIRKILRASKKKEILLGLIQQGTEKLDTYNLRGNPLASFHGKNGPITIYGNNKTYQRELKRFVQLCAETSDNSDDEAEEGTFSHNNREDGPVGDTGQFVDKEEQEKKCCCALI
jgi:hypothetical protein